MSKKIIKKYWSFSEQIPLPLIEREIGFWLWKETKIFTPTGYKYDSPSHLLHVVNEFIAENHITEIISFNDTCGNYEKIPFEGPRYIERVGGIELVYAITEDSLLESKLS